MPAGPAAQFMLRHDNVRNPAHDNVRRALRHFASRPGVNASVGAVPRERTIFWRIDRSNRKQRAIREGKWKYINDGNTMDLLFDLEAEIGERTNLGYRHPEILARLKKSLTAWDRSAQCRRRGEEPERWHWVYTGTCFRLDHRGQAAGGRPVIAERGFVATRGGIDALRLQLHAEACRRCLGQAASALVIADGAVWIWRLAADRFPGVRQRLDFYHAVQHLNAVWQAPYGEAAEQLHAWLEPLVRQFKHDSAVKVVRQLEAVLASLPAGAARIVVEPEVNCLRTHQARMDYRAARRRGEPIGSGAIESTCRQSMSLQAHRPILERTWR